MLQSSVANTILVNLDQVTVTEASVPVVFTDEDILQFIIIEQAQLFPTLDQAIYFDFLTKNTDEENKTIVIVACNIKNFPDLISVRYLKITHEDFSALNLLPWRQREKQCAKKFQLKILAIVAINVSIFMLAISVFYIHIAHQDKKTAASLSHRKKVVIAKLTALEKSNQELQALVYRWKNQIETADRQFHLKEILANIEAQRPDTIAFEKILWRDNSLFVKGSSKEAEVIKTYITLLKQSKIDVQLNFMGNSPDPEFPIQFEVEARGLLT